MQRKFEFTLVDGNPDNKDPKYKDAVRRGCMRAFRRDQRLRRVAEFQAAKAEPPGDSIGHRIVHESAEILPLPRLHSSVGIGSLDPFASLALDLSHSHQSLLAYFHQIIGFIAVPRKPQQAEKGWAERWLEAAISDPLLLAATCFNASSHIDAVARSGRSFQTLQFRELTIVRLQQAVRDEVAMASNLTIGVVLILMTDNLLGGHPSELRLHCSALQNMLRVRGGRLDSSSLGGIVQGWFGWVIPAAAVLLQSSQGNEDPILDLLPLPDAPSKRLRAGDDLLERFRHLQIRVHALRSGQVVDEWSGVLFTRKRCAFEYELTVRWQLLMGSETTTDNRVLRLFYLALLTSSFCCLRGLSPREHVMKAAKGLIIRDILNLKGCAPPIPSVYTEECIFAPGPMESASLQPHNAHNTAETVWAEVSRALRLMEGIDHD